MGYDSAPGDEINQLFTILKDFRRRLAELERPTGSQTASALRTLQDLVNGLLTQVNGVFSGYVQAGGNITSTSGYGIFGAGVTSVPVYSNLVSATPYKVMYVNDAGSFGYVPSSRRYKQDIQTAELAVRDIMRKIRVVTFRYIEAVKLSGDEAAREWGLIAEEVHDLGLYWLVDYEEGKPNGLKHERFAVLLILDAQDKQAQLDDITKRLEAAGI